MKPIIQVRGLSKQYRIGVKRARYGSLRDSLVNAAKAPLRAFKGVPRDKASTIWALKDVSFDVMPGEVVGVIGRNGAGKSTLLKVLTRITEPTQGEVDLYGRVASLLDVGTGFHPELTGRENIYLNGAILGMRKVEIDRKFDEIVAFAEVERFLDTPVKHYSSGMYVRLGFAVAAHLEPEILLVDEVLAVGDLQFQQKCLGRMEVIGRSGRTVLFVSHNLVSVRSLCNRCIYLSGGQLVAIGDSDAIIQRYIGEHAQAERKPEPRSGPLFESPDFVLTRFFTCSDDLRPSTTFRTSQSIHAIFEYQLKKPMPGLRVGLDVVSIADGDTLFRTFDDDSTPVERRRGGWRARCTVPGNLLRGGQYLVTLQVGVHNVAWLINGSIRERVSVEAVDGVNAGYGDLRPGRIMPRLEWQAQWLGDPVG